MEILDHSLEFSSISWGDFAAKDHGDLVGLSDGAVGIEKSLAQLIECGSPTKDQVVAKLDLREEPSVVRYLGNSAMDAFFLYARGGISRAKPRLVSCGFVSRIEK